MTRLGEQQADERRLVRDLGRRFDRADAAAATARAALAEANAQRTAVLAEWAAASGWSAQRVGEVTGLALREVAEAVRSDGARRPAPGEPSPPAPTRLAAGPTPAPNSGPTRAETAVVRDRRLGVSPAVA